MRAGIFHAFQGPKLSMLLHHSWPLFEAHGSERVRLQLVIVLLGLALRCWYDCSIKNNNETHFKYLSGLAVCVLLREAEQEITSVSSHLARAHSHSVCPPHVYSQLNKPEQHMVPQAGETTGQWSLSSSQSSPRHPALGKTGLVPTHRSFTKLTNRSLRKDLEKIMYSL